MATNLEALWGHLRPHDNLSHFLYLTFQVAKGEKGLQLHSSIEGCMNGCLLRDAIFFEEGRN